MALGVSFSRVYNGVHYPSDVLAGAILGAGYGIALVVGAQAIWNFAGREWFPQWHAMTPTLVGTEIGDRRSEIEKNAERGTQNAEPMPSAPDPRPQTPDPSQQWLHLSYLLIIFMLVLRWTYLASGTIGLSQDEAYQWLWSKH